MKPRTGSAPTRLISLLWACTVMLSANSVLATDVPTVKIGRFSEQSLDGWKTKSFAGETDYQLRQSDGRYALHATSGASASGLFFQTTLDLQQTPVLNWSWKVEQGLPGHNEQSKAGDDYPARVYVVFSGGLFFWRTRAINYVWSSNQVQETHWPNAFTGNARMIAVRGRQAPTGEWLMEKRNVLEDYCQLFGGDPNPVAAVAIMTDSDNTGLKTSAWYGDIWFSAD